MNKEEILKFGLEVFNKETDKFERWLKKENVSLGNVSPESLLETDGGLLRVKYCLLRIEYGNFA